MKQYQKLCMDAIGILDQYGRVKGAFGSDDEGYCIIGAIREAKHRGGYKKPSYVAAINKVNNVIPGSAMAWNDGPRSTDEDAKLYLLMVAKGKEDEPFEQFKRRECGSTAN